MKAFDEVTIAVETRFGALYVIKFTIICEIDKDNHIYGLTAQNRVVVGQYMADNTWRLSDPIDLMKFPIQDTIHHDVTEYWMSPICFAKRKGE